MLMMVFMGAGRMLLGKSFPARSVAAGGWSLADVPCALAAGPHSPPAFLSGDGALERLVRWCTGSADVRACMWASGVRGECSYVCAYARGELLLE